MLHYSCWKQKCLELSEDLTVKWRAYGAALRSSQLFEYKYITINHSVNLSILYLRCTLRISKVFGLNII
jgi:hypothetical protein